LTIARYVQSGQWADRTLDDHLRSRARTRGDKLAIVDRRWRLTYQDLDRLAHRAACGLLQQGVGPGDVISIQLPNWAEWLIVHCAAAKIGAVTNSIGAVYREHEVGYILDYAATRLMVIPDRFRGVLVPRHGGGAPTPFRRCETSSSLVTACRPACDRLPPSSTHHGRSGIPPVTSPRFARTRIR
jgi:hypothetical protein